MVQLTGLQTGTPQDDAFIGDINLSALEEDKTEAGILSATINGLKGDDRIEGTATLAPADSENLSLTAIGISQSIIDTGIGDDVVVGRGTALGFEFELGGKGLDVLGSGAGIGLLRSSINVGEGDDSLSFEGTGQGADQEGIGVSSSSVDGGGGDDRIVVTGSRTADDIEGATGILNSSIAGGGQQDVIEIKAGSFDVRNIIATGAEQSLVSGDGGEDKISIEATGADAAAVSGSQIHGRADNDTIVIRSSADGGSATGPGELTSAISEGAKTGSLIAGDGGNDSISINATAESSFEATVYGVRNSTVDGGNGLDTITLEATSNSVFTEAAFAALETKVSGGNNSDTIELIATIETSDVIGFDEVSIAAASQSVVEGGAGDDTILLAVRGNLEDGNSTAGITGVDRSEIYGNSGDDTITVEATDFADYDITDSLLFGGGGDDTFDVGIGNGTLSGGAGEDVAVLDYLNSDAITVTAIANGIRVNGTQTKSGLEGAWTQDILGIENYLVDGVAYSNDALLQTFG